MVTDRCACGRDTIERVELDDVVECSRCGSRLYSERQIVTLCRRDERGAAVCDAQNLIYNNGFLATRDFVPCRSCGHPLLTIAKTR